MGSDAGDYRTQQTRPETSEGSGFSFSSVMGRAREFGGKALDTAKDLGGKALVTAKDAGGKAEETIKREVNDPHNRAVVKQGVDTAVRVGKDTSVGHAIQTRRPEDIARAATEVAVTGGPVGYIAKEALSKGTPEVVKHLPPSAQDKVKPAAEFVQKHGITEIPTTPGGVIHQALKNPQATRDVLKYFGNLHIGGTDQNQQNPQGSRGDDDSAERRVKR